MSTGRQGIVAMAVIVARELDVRFPHIATVHTPIEDIDLRSTDQSTLIAELKWRLAHLPEGDVESALAYGAITAYITIFDIIPRSPATTLSLDLG